MSLPIRLDSEAEEELDAALGWYEAQREGLGLELLDAMEEAKALISEMPRALPPAPGVPLQLGVRRCPVRRFPYWLIFVELREEIRVIAVAHDRRRPAYWRRRFQ